jgi:WD40 repeat protein
MAEDSSRPLDDDSVTEDGDSLGDAELERLADLDDRLGGHAVGDPDASPVDSHPEEPPPEGLDAILLLRQWAAEERGEPLEGLEEAPRRVGRFAIVREVGQGGFARVYEAFDTRLKRRVALKVARPEAVIAPGSRRRFVREAELAARLDHPHIVTILEAGEADGHVYIAEEFCPAGNLGEWLDRHPGPLPPRVAARVVFTLASAVAHSHGFCILHRDIKPANVLLVPGESGPLAAEEPQAARLDVKLADFGLGKLSGSGVETCELTRAGTRIGTPVWMAPEQVDPATGPVGPATDIHALGLLLDRLLTGRCLHAGADDADTLRRVLTCEPMPADQVVRGIPPDIAAVTTKCLAKHPVDRYPTVTELAGDLARFLDGRPTLARPVSLMGHVLRFSARHRGSLAAAAVVFVALMVASGAILLQAGQRRQLAARATEVRSLQAVATLRRGFESWRTGDVSGALTQLDRCRDLDPQLADTIAGRWLRTRLHGEKEMLLGTENNPVDLFALAVSPDGAMLAVGGGDGTLRILHTAKADARDPLSIAIHDEINQVVFSPDGTLVATAGQDGRVAVIEVSSGRRVREWSVASGPLFGLAWSPDGRTLACGGASREIILLAADADASGRSLGSPLDEASSPDGFETDIESLVFVGPERIAAAFGDRVALLDTSTGRVFMTLLGHEGSVEHLGVSADGRRIVSGGTDKRPRVWDTDSGELIAILPAHPSWVAGCKFTSDASAVVTGCRDGVVRIVPIGAREAARTLVGHRGRVWNVALLPDGDVVSSGADGTVRRWDPRRTEELAAVRSGALGHGEIGAVVPLPGGDAIVTWRDGAPMTRVDSTGVTAARSAEHGIAVTGIAVGDSRHRLAVADAEYRITTVSVPGEDGGPPQQLPDSFRGQSFGWLSAARLLVGDATGRILVWNDRLRRAEVIGQVGTNIDALAISDVSGLQAVVVAGKSVRLHGFSADGSPRGQGRMLLELPATMGTARVVAWAPDGESFVIGTNVGGVERYDAVTGASLGSFARHVREICSLQWSPDGRTLVSADAECVRFSDVRTTTVFDELRPGWSIESARLASNVDGSAELVVGGNAGSVDESPGRVAFASIPAP